MYTNIKHKFLRKKYFFSNITLSKQNEEKHIRLGHAGIVHPPV